MAEQRRHEIDQRARQPHHLDQHAEEDEQRHREQDELGHPLVHAVDHDRQIGMAVVSVR